jgi:hypothetical protein
VFGKILGRSGMGGRQDQHHTVLETDLGDFSVSESCPANLKSYLLNT